MSAIAKDRQDLIDLFGEEALAALDLDRSQLSAEMLTLIDEVLDGTSSDDRQALIAALLPIHTAVLSASDEDLPAVVESILAGQVAR